MRIGFGLPISGSWATGPNMVEVARRAEDLGYASLWTFQRLLHPAAGDWGPTYRSVHDPIVALAHVAAVTERVRLGLAIVNVPFLSPIVLAKQLTTLDHVCAGRLDAGLGLGWSPDEFAAVGVPYERRGARAEEFIRCLQAIWTNDVVDFEGEFYRMPPSLVDPKPVQRPHPPLLLGGSAEAALRRVGRLADGWISASRQDLSRLAADIEVIREAAREAGRQPETLRFVVRGVVHLGREQQDAQGDRRPLTGTVERINADLAILEDHGVTEVFLDLNFDPRIGSPDADPHECIRRAERVLEAFAPSAR
jgi:probable F420-dependent oxidoreductase